MPLRLTSQLSAYITRTVWMVSIYASGCMSLMSCVVAPSIICYRTTYSKILNRRNKKSIVTLWRYYPRVWEWYKRLLTMSHNTLNARSTGGRICAHALNMAGKSLCRWGMSAGLPWTRHCTSGFHKMWGIFWVGVELLNGFSRRTLLHEDSYVGDTGSLPALSQAVAPDTTITEIRPVLSITFWTSNLLYFKFMAKPTPREKLTNLHEYKLPIYNYWTIMLIIFLQNKTSSSCVHWLTTVLASAARRAAYRAIKRCSSSRRVDSRLDVYRPGLLEHKTFHVCTCNIPL